MFIAIWYDNWLILDLRFRKTYDCIFEVGVLIRSNCHELVTKQKKKVLLSCCRDNIFNKNMPLSSLGVTTLLWQLETFPRQYWGTLLRSRRYEGARARWSWRKPNEYKRTFYLPTYTCYATYMHPTPNYALMLLSMFAKIYTFCTLHIIS